MKNCFFLLLTAITLVGCSKATMKGERPPEMYVEIAGQTLETALGTYCWNGTCVDTVGPVELLKGKEPYQVQPGITITFNMNFEPKPNQFHLLENNGMNEQEINLDNQHFSAPTQKGVYYYAYGVWWMDEKQENLSHGDASYAFVLEVK